MSGYPIVSPKEESQLDCPLTKLSYSSVSILILDVSILHVVKLFFFVKIMKCDKGCYNSDMVPFALVSLIEDLF